MPSNIEIKARVDDLEHLDAIARSLAQGPCELLEQEDVFFHVPDGWLKLRVLGDGHGELIAYARSGHGATMRSDYLIYSTETPEELRRVLARSLGEGVVVRKRRRVYLVGQTRVHLDEVVDLGSFLELEVVLRPDQHPEEGREIAGELMERFGIRRSDLLFRPYAELLARESSV
jgi:predicted adenylyl cyclase CyaB